MSSIGPPPAGRVDRSRARFPPSLIWLGNKIGKGMRKLNHQGHEEHKEQNQSFLVFLVAFGFFVVNIPDHSSQPMIGQRPTAMIQFQFQSQLSSLGRSRQALFTIAQRTEPHFGIGPVRDGDRDWPGF